MKDKASMKDKAWVGVAGLLMAVSLTVRAGADAPESDFQIVEMETYLGTLGVPRYAPAPAAIKLPVSLVTCAYWR
ncbi:hypothetical protein GCM10010872_27590 [Dyella flava]|uniref:hypothetical protein n=1 Tax=Dyella flava TaxID=1920170 RepID=UPI00235BF2BA|nr:hypothetical protein GCM10010872_27590 [Dyella flava]